MARSLSYRVDGHELRRRRENAGWSMRQLAQVCKDAGQPVDHSQISHYESGAKTPRPDRLKALAKALGCKPDDLKRKPDVLAEAS